MKDIKHSITPARQTSDKSSANDHLLDRKRSYLLRLYSHYPWSRYTEGVNALAELSKDWILIQEISKLLESSWLVGPILKDRRLATQQRWLLQKHGNHDPQLSVRSVSDGKVLYSQELWQLKNYPYASAEVWALWDMNVHQEAGWTLYLPSEHDDVMSGYTHRTIGQVRWCDMEHARDPWE